MKILALTCMYGRTNVARIFLESMKRLKIQTFAVVDTAEDWNLVREYKQSAMLPTPTPKLGAKWNLGAKAVLGMSDWTHLLVIGDDDILADEFVGIAEVCQDTSFTGLSQTYMIEPSTERAQIFEYTKPIAIGAGRVYRREVIEKIDGQLFDPELEAELDWSSDMILLEHLRLTPLIVDRDIRSLMTGIKTDKNIWGFDNFGGGQVKYDTAIAHFGDKEKQLLKLI